VLIQPRTEIFDSLKSGPTLPLSLLSAVRLAVKEFDVSLVDQRIDADWRSTLEKAIRNGAWATAITSVTGRQLIYAAQAAQLSKKLGAKVIWGGVHATLLDWQVLKDGLADIVVRGEGEVTLLELLHALKQETPLDAVQGISFLKEGRLVRTSDRKFIDLASMPDVPYQLAGEAYVFSRKGRKALYFETSRGCPNACDYCYNTAFHKRRWRPEPGASVLGRLTRLKRNFPQVGHISIVDDNFLADRKRALEIASGLLKLDLGLTYQVQGANVNDVDRLSEHDLHLLKRSGCVRLDMGVESGSKKIIAQMNKRLDLGAVQRVNKKLKEHGIVPWYNFMAGFPGETKEDLYSTLSLLLDLTRRNPDALVSPIYCLAPYPGTNMYSKAVDLGVEFPKTTRDWGRFSLDKPLAPGMSEVDIETLASLYFFSIFVDKKIDEYDTFPGIALAARLYRPIARFRLSRLLLKPAPEKTIFEILVELKQKAICLREHL